TEKSFDGLQNKKYTFKVATCADKTQIKVAVEDIFGVKVAAVNTVNVGGKKKRQGKSEGMTNDYKKAIVTLTQDSKTIEFFDSLA
ncbi:MAG: 50S ribosomal protein L23, partial [Clostridia bacterium]